MHCVDEVLIHLDRHLGAVQRSVQRGFIAARIGKKLELLDLCGQDCRGGVAEIAIAAVQAAKRIFSQRAVRAVHERDIAAVRDRMLFPCAVLRVVKLQVGIPEHGIDAVRRLRQLACRCQQLFLRIRQDVLALAADFVQIALIQAQLRQLTVKFLQRLVRNRQNLRRFKGARTVAGNHQRNHLGRHALIQRYGGILIAFALCVAVQAVKCDAHLIAEGQKFIQCRRGGAELPAIGRYGFGKRLCAVICRLPQLLRRKNILNRPGILGAQLRAGRNLLCHRITPFLKSNVIRI